jgi:hypothetical protein
LFAVNVAAFVPPLATPSGDDKLAVEFVIDAALMVPPVMVTLELDSDTLEIAPPVIDTLARLLVPLPMPFTPFTTVVKLLSNCDNGIDVVAPANVFGIVIGSAIRT